MDFAPVLVVAFLFNVLANGKGQGWEPVTLANGLARENRLSRTAPRPCWLDSPFSYLEKRLANKSTVSCSWLLEVWFSSRPGLGPQKGSTDRVFCCCNNMNVCTTFILSYTCVFKNQYFTFLRISNKYICLFTYNKAYTNLFIVNSAVAESRKNEISVFADCFPVYINIIYYIIFWTFTAPSCFKFIVSFRN